VAWVLIWRNWDAENHMAPFTGHASADDFIDFAGRPFIVMQNDISFNLYQWNPE
jgi:hypothetical protein